MIDFNWRELSGGESECVITDFVSPYEYRVEKDISLIKVNNIALEGWRVISVKDPSDPLKLTLMFQRGGGFSMICGGEAGDRFAVVGQAHNSHASTTTEFIVEKKWTYGDIATTGLLILISAWIIFTGLYKIIKRKSFSKK